MFLAFRIATNPPSNLVIVLWYQLPTPLVAHVVQASFEGVIEDIILNSALKAIQPQKGLADSVHKRFHLTVRHVVGSPAACVPRTATHAVALPRGSPLPLSVARGVGSVRVILEYSRQPTAPSRGHIHSAGSLTLGK